MPVDQTGETILFVHGEGWMEAHIQIAYDPETTAREFAWVVPVMALPELSVGSQTLLDAMATATAPRYGFSTWGEPCSGDDGSTDPCAGEGDDGGDAKLDAGASPPSEPEVVAHELVGAFEMFVIEGGTPQGVMTWLGDNGFAQDETAEPILAEYLEEDFLFVAFKLAHATDASEIHPVVLRYAGDEPCVPIRLTRIAAVEDMVIRTYFLAESRVVPSNYKHVELNPLKIDFLGRGANYNEVVAMAVDEAGGHGWVTEYAGAASIVPTGRLAAAQWPIASLLGATSLETVQFVLDQGWVQCDGIECAWDHPLLEGILAEWLPLPDDFELESLWYCPECFADDLDESAWDSVRFVAELETRIVAPTQHGLALLDTWPTLTRMVTTLSPVEMTRDPFFHQNPDLPDVRRTGELGSSNLFCDGASSFNLPDGRLVATPGGSWPDIAPELMPWAASVADMASAGAPQVLTDNGELIAELLARFNELYAPRDPFRLSCGEDSSGGLDGSLAGVADSGGSEPRGVGACACTSAGGDRGLLLLMVGVFGLGLATRARRSNSCILSRVVPSGRA